VPGTQPPSARDHDAARALLEGRELRGSRLDAPPLPATLSPFRLRYSLSSSLWVTSALISVFHSAPVRFRVGDNVFGKMVLADGGDSLL